MFVIIDMADKMPDTSSRNLEMLKMFTKEKSDYYPETMGAMYIINAPFLFQSVWAVTKGFFDEKTRAKM